MTTTSLFPQKQQILIQTMEQINMFDLVNQLLMPLHGYTYGFTGPPSNIAHYHHIHSISCPRSIFHQSFNININAVYRTCVLFM